MKYLVVILFLVLPVASRAADRSSNLLFCEQFEKSEQVDGSGYDEVHSEGDVVQRGNTLEPDASTAFLGSPAGWGKEFCYMAIGSQAGGSLSRTELAQPVNKLFSQVEFIVISDSMTEGRSICLAVAKAQRAGEGDWPVAWALHLGKANGKFYLFVRVADGAVVHKAEIKNPQRYSFQIEYNVSAGKYSIYLNNMAIGSGPILPAYPFEISWLILGSSGSSAGRNISVALDNFLHSEDGWPVVPTSGTANP